MPRGRAAKAALVGANTVNGPGLFSVSTRPAAFTAATSVVWSAEFTALSTMSLVGYIAAPPTIGSTTGAGVAIAVWVVAMGCEQAASAVRLSSPTRASERRFDM